MNDVVMDVVAVCIGKVGKSWWHTGARELARASHSNIRAALASDTVFGGTVNRLKPFCGAVHDAGG